MNNISHPNPERRITRVNVIDHLDEELILEIFQFRVLAPPSSCHPNELHPGPLRALPRASRNNAPVSLSQVSTWWRTISLEHRRLWIEVYLHRRVTRGEFDAERMMAALNVFVERSGTLSLCTYFDCEAAGLSQVDTDQVSCLASLTWVDTPGIDASDTNNLAEVHIGLQTYLSSPGHLRGLRVVGPGFSHLSSLPFRRIAIDSRLLVSSPGWNALHDLTLIDPMDIHAALECLASLRVSNLCLRFTQKRAGKLPVQPNDPLFIEELICTLSQ